jgi:hypothetical protein
VRRRIEDRLAGQPDWRPFAAPKGTVRCCTDGLSRPASHCVQLDDGRFVPKHTAQQKDGATGA